METSLFYQGIPAPLSPGYHLSPGWRLPDQSHQSVAGTLRLDLAQFREPAAFSPVLTDLDAKPASASSAAAPNRAAQAAAVQPLRHLGKCTVFC